MSQKEAREFDKKRLHEMYQQIEPAKNEHIAREALTIAERWLNKAENQAAHIENLEARAQRMIDADALERDGWKMSRIVRISKDEMEMQTRKPTDLLR